MKIYDKIKICFHVGIIKIFSYINITRLTGVFGVKIYCLFSPFQINKLIKSITDFSNILVKIITCTKHE